jgi:hypothetical protein
MVPTATDVSAWQSTQAAPSTPLTTILRANMPAWDHHTGVITPEDVNAQLTNPANTGDKAAAVAFMADFENANHFQIDLTPQMITHYEQANAAGTYTGWDDAYSADQSHLATEMADGVYQSGHPALSQLSQDFGDCYFVSGVGWMTANNEPAAANLIHVEPNGTYDVHFPGYHQQKVTLTQAEVAYAANDTPGGTSQIILEKAAGMVRNNTDALHYLQGGAANPFAGIDNGGYPAMTITLLTGHQANTVQIHQDGYNLNQMRQDLSANLPHNMVLASTTKSIDGVPGDHALAVLGYDKATDTVKVWDPWGSEPPDSHVTQDGNGVFTMKAADFYQTFHQLDFEMPGTHGDVNQLLNANVALNASDAHLGPEVIGGTALLVATAAVTAAVLIHRRHEAAERRLLSGSGKGGQSVSNGLGQV